MRNRILIIILLIAVCLPLCSQIRLAGYQGKHINSSLYSTWYSFRNIFSSSWKVIFLWCSFCPRIYRVTVSSFDWLTEKAPYPSCQEKSWYEGPKLFIHFDELRFTSSTILDNVMFLLRIHRICIWLVNPPTMIGGQSMFFRMPEMYLDISDNLSSFILSFLYLVLKVRWI